MSEIPTDTKKCDRCGKSFPNDTDLPEGLRELLAEVSTCTECLQKSLQKHHEIGE